MNRPGDESEPDIERLVDAISDGSQVEWGAELGGERSDAETLEALKLIDQVARVHRGDAPAEGGTEPAARTWGGLTLRECIGTGVYGEVYRAFDPGLRREVALKLWSATARPHTIERLLAEARALASVRHPNVLVVYGADVHDGRVGMWAELLEGDTLEALLAGHGPVNWREAALMGIELCRALAAVHAIGLVHCDVKPANVMRERGGRVVLMDFGSAGRFGASAGATAASAQGTPLAMAPEVLAGVPATPAADLYGLGVLLFRMISARYPIEAYSLDELRAALASAPVPSLRSVRPEVPVAFARVLERALERDPAARFASAAEMERALAEALSTHWADRAPGSRARALRRLVVGAAALAGVAVLTFATAQWLRRPPALGAGRPMQFTLTLPLGEHIEQFANVAVSPDGGSVVYASVDTLGHRALWLRHFDTRDAHRIPGSEGAWHPFWSPDSRNIAFFANGNLERVAVDGGAVRVVCRAVLGRGGSWSRSGVIVFAGSTQDPLLRVDAGGGRPVPATAVDTANGEVSHRWPCFLPDGDHFLYVVTPARDGAFALYAGSLRSDRHTYIGAVESGVVYTSGMLVYVARKTLEARPFDVRALKWRGEPVPICDLPAPGGSMAEPHASVSQNGTLVYSSLAESESRLEWLDLRGGGAQPLSIGPYFHPAVSPDGRQIAVEQVEAPGRSNVWLIDAASGAATRWTDDPGFNRGPVWSPRGDSIAFASNRSGSYRIYTRALEGSLTETVLYGPPGALMLWPDDWQPGGLLAFNRYEPGTGYNVYELRGGAATPMARTPAAELNGRISPDRRWLAYDSDATGVARVYVMDRGSGERWTLPVAGQRPRWARATGRLYYHTPGGVFIEVTPVRDVPPDRWHTEALRRAGRIDDFDVDPRGTRAVCCLRTEPGRPEEITVLANLPQAIAHGL